MKKWLSICLIILVALLSMYLDWVAYRQRFPHTEWWTYFFRDR